MEKRWLGLSDDDVQQSQFYKVACERFGLDSAERRRREMELYPCGVGYKDGRLLALVKWEQLPEPTRP